MIRYFDNITGGHALLFERDKDCYTVVYTDDLDGHYYNHWLFADFKIYNKEIFVRYVFGDSDLRHMRVGLTTAIHKMKPGFKVEVRLHHNPIDEPRSREFQKSISEYRNFMLGGPKPTNETPFWRKI